MLLAVDLHLGARVLAEQDAIARLHVELADRAVLLDLAVAHRDDLALDGLLLGRVRDDDPTTGLLFGFQTTDQDAVSKRTDLHGMSPSDDGLRVADVTVRSFLRTVGA